MTRTRECTVPSRPAPTGWEWQETDAGTRVKWSRRRVQLLEIRKTNRSGRGHSVETEACNYRKLERQLATSGLTEYRCDVGIKVYGLQAELQFEDSLKCEY